MTPFRQPIRPGDVGSDVRAVKRAYIAMGIKGAGTLALTTRAGPAFVGVTKTVQRQHHLKVDGIYGATTHSVVAPNFDLWGVVLYKAAMIRKDLPPPASLGDAAVYAKRLLVHHERGDYRADNERDLSDIEATALGKPVWSQGGYLVHIDARPLRLLCWLIEERSYGIGTFAICSDHHDDGRRGHSGGLAVDISSVDGVSISSAHARALTLAAAQAVHAAPDLRPRQLICDGFGYEHDDAIAALTIPYAGYYGYQTMSEHRNHLHCGY